MCGIAGILRWSGPKIRDEEIKSMITAIRHRGPDGEGIFLRERVALGHRRLSIIDLEGGRQPMLNEDGQVAVTFNGEIYNFQELVEILKTKGHIFKTRSDTEVIVHAWEEWGKDCVRRFRGMFAFAIADWKQNKIFLARDHFGIKPLYYVLKEKQLFFASEIQALKAVDDCPSDIDLQSLDQYLMLQYIPAPRTIFKQMFKLLPAHCMTVHFDGRVEGPDRYWNIKFSPKKWNSLDECAEALEERIRDSVKAHLVADVDFGAFLSGGIDSSVVVSCMAQELNRPIKTFSIGFQHAKVNELSYAKQVAERWNTNHQFEVLNPDVCKILPKLVQHYGEPFGDYSSIPTYYVSQFAKHSVPMVLSGDGGDEAFGGYKSYLKWVSFLFPNRPIWKRIMYPFAKLLMPQRYGEPRESLEHWYNMIQIMSAPFRFNLWKKEFHNFVNLPIEIFENSWRKMAHSYSPLEKVRSLDYDTYLPDDILVKVDVASMAHGLEVRTPLIDVKVVEFLQSIPSHFLLRESDKNSKEWMTKFLLRKILTKYFPNDFINRPKKGFSPPLNEWLTFDEQFFSFVKDVLLDSRASISCYFEREIIVSLMKEQKQRANQGHLIWMLLFLEVWLKGFRNGNR